MAKKTKKKTDAEALVEKVLAVGKNRAIRSGGANLGFANAREAKLFRAVAATHPSAVAINEKSWKVLADAIVQMGYMRVVIGPHGATYRLTPGGVARAKTEGLIDS